MNDLSPRFWPLFLELYESLPRQGPGNRQCAGRALALCPGLPDRPSVIDLGCGAGGQTIQLAGLLDGSRIVAVDSHEGSVARLRAEVGRRGLSGRISAVAADMLNLDFPQGSFDLVWSEGALYNIGIGNAMHLSRRLLRSGGYVAFTDAVWRRNDPPGEVRKSFEVDYPAMSTAVGVMEVIERSGFELKGHFTLPDEAWWGDFYTPMEARIAEMRRKYAGDGEALAVMDMLAAEPEMHRRHSDCYAYEFFVARRPE
ncbi:MAG: class I SAM-dependent methyltransferase [Candidatus Solibacter sp.]|nr:class I SAM-dependent methyltransferase [Candidatus Solibacter sp.]